MNKLIFTTIAIICTVTLASSQDVITMRSGEDIRARILEVGSTEIKYKKFDNPDGPIFTTSKEEILMVRYENGTKDIFNQTTVTPAPATSPATDYYVQGRTDATRYYKDYKTASTITLVVSLLSPIAGLIPAIATSSTRPKDIHLDYPNSELMKKTDYSTGYNQKARRIKQGRIWTNWGIGLGVNFIAIVLITAGQE